MKSYHQIQYNGISLTKFLGGIMIKKEFSSLLKSKGLKATMATVLLVPVLFPKIRLESIRQHWKHESRSC